MTRIFPAEFFLSDEISSVIYRIENISDGKFYIGSSINYRNRWSHHLNLLRNKNHHNIHLQRAWDMYGESSFRFTIMLHVCDNTLIREIEQKYLDYYFKFFKKNLYNLSKLVIGGGCGNIVGSKNPKSKLNDNDVIQIRKEFNKLSDKLIADKYDKLAKKYEVSTLTISRIIRNKLWKHL